MKNLLLFLGSALFSLTLSAQSTLYTNDFSGGSSGWSLGAGGNFDTWVVNNVYNCSSTTPNQGGGNYMHIYDDLFYDYCAHSLFAGLGSGGIVYATQTSDFSTIGYANVEITFDWLCQGQTGPLLPSFGFIDYSTNSGSSWINITSPMAEFSGQPTWTNVVINNSGMGNQSTVRIRFGFNNSGYGLNPAFAVDNLTITGLSGSCSNTGGTAGAVPSNICAGDTSIVSVIGSVGTIQWEQSPDGITGWTNVVGGSGATTPNYTTPPLFDTTYYRAKLSEPSCPDEYSTVTVVNINPPLVADVNIYVFPNDTACAEDTIGFGVNVTNGGPSPTYEWQVNGVPSGTGSSFSSTSLNDGDVVRVIMTSSAICVSGSPDTSNSISMTINPLPNVAITGSTVVCDGNTETLTASGASTYEWINSSTSTSINVTPTADSTFWVIGTDGNGCADTAFHMINFLQHSSFVQSPTICANETFTVGSNVYSTTGNYVDTLVAANSCDSIVTTNLTVDPPVNINTSVSGPVITASAAGATYQWVYCPSMNPVVDSTGQSILVPQVGSYAVIVTVNGCTDTSDCVAIGSSGTEIEYDPTFNVFPNPSYGSITISGTFDGNYEIVNGVGQVIRSFNLNGSNNHLIQINDLSGGVYFVVGKNKYGTVTEKIIVTQ